MKQKNLQEVLYDSLYKVLSSMSLDELKKLDCFSYRTLEDKKIL